MKVEKVLDVFVSKMRAEGVPRIAIDNFCFYYLQLSRGAAGKVSEEEIEPVGDLQVFEDLSAACREGGRDLLSSTVHLVLNGGLGTSMGMLMPKSSLQIRGGLSFLDIIAKRSLLQKTALVLMNSFATRVHSLRALDNYLPGGGDLPRDFLQHKTPKVAIEGLKPVQWEANPVLEWCPPGHGDIYPALSSSGMLDELLGSGYRYAFVSNADNLGATVDETILGFFAQSEAPFLMEVADRTEADKKGGHLARRRADGRLILREAAQCPEDERGEFSDINRHRFFNTNNLWLDLAALSRLLDKRRGVLGLPMILNRKTVDPRDPDSLWVYQLETAMGGAIEVFEGAMALKVDRSRFLPVKTTNDLLVVRSDAVTLTPDLRLTKNPERAFDTLPVVSLDRRYYRNIDSFESRYPKGVPSLVECETFSVEGDITFGADVKVRGNVSVEQAQMERIKPNSTAKKTSRAFIEDGAILSGP